MATENEACNELEQKLVDAQIGRISSNALLGLSQPRRRIVDRADLGVKVGRDYGIALNLGFEIDFDMEPETVDELIDALTAHTKH